MIGKGIGRGRTGWTKANHKYIDRIWKNNRWNYIYKTAATSPNRGLGAVKRAYDAQKVAGENYRKVHEKQGTRHTLPAEYLNRYYTREGKNNLGSRLPGAQKDRYGRYTGLVKDKFKEDYNDADNRELNNAVKTYEATKRATNREMDKYNKSAAGKLAKIGRKVKIAVKYHDPKILKGIASGLGKLVRGGRLTAYQIGYISKIQQKKIKDLSSNMSKKAKDFIGITAKEKYLNSSKDIYDRGKYAGMSKEDAKFMREKASKRNEVNKKAYEESIIGKYDKAKEKVSSKAQYAANKAKNAAQKAIGITDRRKAEAAVNRYNDSRATDAVKNRTVKFNTSMKDREAAYKAHERAKANKEGAMERYSKTPLGRAEGALYNLTSIPGNVKNEVDRRKTEKANAERQAKKEAWQQKISENPPKTKKKTTRKGTSNR